MTTLSSFNTFFPQLSGIIRLIQEDELKPGNILVSVANTLVSVPLTKDGVAEVIVGNENGSSKTYNNIDNSCLKVLLHY